MKKKHLIMLLAIIGLALAGGLVGCKKTDDKSLESQTYSTEAAKVEETRVGTYDSRAVALAYFREDVGGQMRIETYGNSFGADYEKAKAEGDESRVKEIDDIMSTYQEEMGRQVFGSAPPTKALEHIADRIPAIKEQAGVDVLISKWDKEELAKYVPKNFVDVTDMLVQLYNPNEEVLRTVEEIKNSKPKR